MAQEFNYGMQGRGTMEDDETRREGQEFRGTHNSGKEDRGRMEDMWDMSGGRRRGQDSERTGMTEGERFERNPEVKGTDEMHRHRSPTSHVGYGGQDSERTGMTEGERFQRNPEVEAAKEMHRHHAPTSHAGYGGNGGEFPSEYGGPAGGSYVEDEHVPPGKYSEDGYKMSSNQNTGFPSPTKPAGAFTSNELRDESSEDSEYRGGVKHGMHHHTAPFEGHHGQTPQTFSAFGETGRPGDDERQSRYNQPHEGNYNKQPTPYGGAQNQESNLNEGPYNNQQPSPYEGGPHQHGPAGVGHSTSGYTDNNPVKPSSGVGAGYEASTRDEDVRFDSPVANTVQSPHKEGLMDKIKDHLPGKKPKHHDQEDFSSTEIAHVEPKKEGFVEKIKDKITPSSKHQSTV